MKMMSFGVIVAFLVYASHAVQYDIAGSTDGDDVLKEEAGDSEAGQQIQSGSQGGPFFDRLKGLVSRSRHANASRKESAAAAPDSKKATVAVLAKEVANVKAELQKIFRKPASHNVSRHVHGVNASQVHGVRATEGAGSLLGATHRNLKPHHGNAATRRTSTAIPASQRKAAVRTKYVTAREPAVRVPETPGATRRMAQAVGDPHMTTIHGQRFDLAQPGAHALVVIPRFARLRADTLLHVDAEVSRVGMSCEDIYIRSLNVTGEWVTSARNGMHFRAGAGAKSGLFAKWWHLGRVQLKVVDGVTEGGTPYLNFFIRNLGHTGLAIGGLLGDDDHTAAATPSKGCMRTIALLGRTRETWMVEKHGRKSRSRAKASLLQVD